MALFKFWKLKKDEKKDIENKEFLSKDFSVCCQNLWEGCSMEEILVTIPSAKKFKEFLEENNFTYNEALAIYQYSISSNMILGIARGTTTKENIKLEILKEMYSRIDQETPDHFKEEIKENVSNFIKNLDISKKYKDLEKEAKDFSKKIGMSSHNLNTTVFNLVRLERTNDAIKELQNSLNKHQLKKDMVLYRGVKSSYLNDVFGKDYDVNILVGQVISNTSATSTTYDKDAGFIKHENIDLIFEINAPSETKGINIEGLSGYSCEKEVLLDGHNLEITEVRKETIENNVSGKTEKWIVSCDLKPLDMEKATIIDNKKNTQEDKTTKMDLLDI